MRVVTNTHTIFERFGELRGIELFKEYGYDGMDYSMFSPDPTQGLLGSAQFEARAQAMRKKADACGIPFTQSHAPFPSYRPGDDAFNAAIIPHLERSLIVSGILGVEYVIVHPVTLPEGQKEFNSQLYESLEPLCRKYGVKIALENMFDWDMKADRGLPGACSPSAQFAEYVDMLPRDCFAACLDIGHVGVVGLEKAADAIRTLGHDRLKALHVHDNDDRYDLHELPFLCKVEWDAVIAALKEIRYDGDFTFEADSFIMGFPDALIGEASKFMARLGRYFTSQIEG